MGNENAWRLSLSPRAWQITALELWRREHRGVVSVVTGGGKTVFAEMCILDFMTTAVAPRIVVLVPTLALLDQWYVALKDELGVREEELGTYSGEGRPDSPKLINLVVLNTGRTVAPVLASGDTENLLIVDECHRAGSPENAKALLGAYRATLGLSATPEREYDPGFAELVQPRIGSVIYEYDYQTARKDEVIAPFDLINVEVSLTDPERIKYDRITRAIARRRRADGEASDQRLEALLRRRASVVATAAMRIPTAVKLVDLHRGERALIFHERVSDANVISSLLNGRGHSVAVYHTGISPELRRSNLMMFRRGMLDVLVCCRALDEGLNVPEATVGVIASSTASHRQRIQRLGRILRPARGKATASIYTIYATDLEERRLSTEAASLQDVASIRWLRASSNG